MNFPKTLVFLLVLNLTVLTGFAATLTPPAQAAIPQPAATHAAPGQTGHTVQPASGPAGPTASDIRDIRGPISIPYGWLWAAYIGVGLVLAAALYGAWRWYRTQAAERAKGPHEIALERLEKARELLQPQHGREYSFAVSEIVRTYIEARFHERAARRTTEEFLRNLLSQAEGPLSAQREQLEYFLHYCDLAKFAKWHLAVPDMESMHESARAFILATQPQPTAKVPASANPAAAVDGPNAPAIEPQLTPAQS